MRIFLFLGLTIAALFTVSGWAERLILYPFDPREVAPTSVELPNISAETLDVTEAELVIWHAQAKRNKPLILYFHGNAGNLASRAGRFRRFTDRGYGLLAPAYRGSSGSTGAPSEEALIADAKAIAATLAPNGKYHKRNQPIVIYAESLGTAVAIALLESDPGFADAVILEAPLASLHALAKHHYPSLADFSTAFDSQWPSLERAETALTAPLLVMHGTGDTLIPQSQGKAIYQAAPSKQKSFLSVSGAGHTDLWRSDTLPKIWRFIETHSR